MTESAHILSCGGEELVALLHAPENVSGDTGVVIVVGGPQYRAGSHRQFVSLARALSDAGIPALRFDTRGMGDSSGSFPGFENLDDDIEAAIDGLIKAAPSVKRIILWGLCDAASAILFYAHQEPRVTGIVLVNPWVRTEATHAQSQMRHYYRNKFFSAAFWRRLFGGGVSVGDALRSFVQTLLRSKGNPTEGADSSVTLPGRMVDGLNRYSGPVLFITSGRDLTAQEFLDMTRNDPKWQNAMADPSVTRNHLEESDHTFSREEWQIQSERWTIDWINKQLQD